MLENAGSSSLCLLSSPAIPSFDFESWELELPLLLSFMQ